MILGLGIDVVSVKGFEELLADRHSRFAEATFTSGESAYADGAHGRRSEHLAARFAAKEATLKALDGACMLVGVHPPAVALTDIEVTRDLRGRPALHLRGAAAALAEQVGADRAHVTLTHDGDTAAAVVVFERLCQDGLVEQSRELAPRP